MAFSPDALRQRLTLLVATQGRARSAVATATTAEVRRAWALIEDPHDPRHVAAFTAATTQAVRAGRRRTNDVTDSYMRRVLDAMGVKPPAGRAVAAEDPRLGVPIAREYARVPAQYRWDISQGATDVEARAAATRRAEVMAEMDLTLAARDAVHQVFEATPAVTGYRRVLHPELSRTGVCALCIVASTRLYFKRDLMPIHARCKCEPLPLVDGRTAAVQSITDEDLAAAYRLAGGTAAEKLKKVRIVVEHHGELGPTLRDAAHAFRGPEDLPKGRRTIPSS